MRAFLLLAAPLVTASLSACFASERPANPPHAAPTVSDEGWTSLRWEDRHDVMTFAVLPTMARAFQRFRGSPDPDLTCRSCHGPDAERVAYQMPHGLTPLDPAHMPDPNDRVVRFMTQEVTPKMADLLGEPPYDPKTKAGFSCFGCHPSL